MAQNDRGSVEHSSLLLCLLATISLRIPWVAYEQGDPEQGLVLTIQAFLLFDALHAPDRATSLRMLARIREQMDESTFIGHWRALAGKRSLPDIPPADGRQALIQTLIEFIQAPTWRASQQFLEVHPELLQPQADTILVELATKAALQEQERISKAFETHRLLLQRCRQIGIIAAYAEWNAGQDPKGAFLAVLNDLCGQVVTTLNNGVAAQREALAAQIENMMQGELPVEGSRSFLQLLTAWLREQDTQALERQSRELLPGFREAYEQMKHAVEQQTIPGHTATAPEEVSELTIEDLPVVVAALIRHGTVEHQHQFADTLEETQQQLMREEIAPLGRFLRCLVAALRGETPDMAALEAPFTDLWQEFQDELQRETSEKEEEKEANDA